MLNDLESGRFGDSGPSACVVDRLSTSQHRGLLLSRRLNVSRHRIRYNRLREPLIPRSNLGLPRWSDCQINPRRLQESSVAMTVDFFGGKVKPGTLVRPDRISNSTPTTHCEMRNHLYEVDAPRSLCYFKAKYDSWFLVLKYEEFGFVLLLSPDGIKVSCRASFFDWQTAITTNERKDENEV